MKDRKLYIAPVQGHTDAAWRHFHAEVYGAAGEYATPFIRLEHGALRDRDVRDFTSSLNGNQLLTAQIIFRDVVELDALVEKTVAAGARHINLNMGCPFPLQTGHGRGAAVLDNPGVLQHIPRLISQYPDVKFSAKMRLGMHDPDTWRNAIPFLNESRLEYVAMHPRVARQQYGGELFLDKFEDFLRQSKNPVVFNGEIKTPSDITSVFDRFPDIAGVMAARGLLGRPSLFMEYLDSKEISKEERIEMMLRFHRLLFEHYSSVLCGERQILDKIKPFWEFAEDEIGRKPWKNIKKSVNMPKYQSAVASIRESIL